MSTLQRPHRAQDHRLRPVTVILSDESIDIPVAEILSRIQRIIETKLGPAYLFVNQDRCAYVLNAQQSTLPFWLRDRFAEYVGCYARVRIKGQPTLEPTLEGLCSDVSEHLAGLNAQAGRAGCAP